MTAAERAAPRLLCPDCEHAVERRDGSLSCPNCSATVPVVDGVPRYPVHVDRPSLPACFDALSAIYETPLWFRPVYRFVGGPFAPADDRAAVAGALDAAGGTVLDVACGTGRFTRYVAREADFVRGIDVSDGMLRRAAGYARRDGVENVAFARMSAEDLRFEPGSFDGVACCWALHLFPDRPRAVEEMHRVLRPGGRLAGVTLGTDVRLAVPGVRAWLRRTVGAHVFADDDLRDLLLDAGFADVDLDGRGAARFFGARK